MCHSGCWTLWPAGLSIRSPAAVQSWIFGSSEKMIFSSPLRSGAYGLLQSSAWPPGAGLNHFSRARHPSCRLLFCVALVGDLMPSWFLNELKVTPLRENRFRSVLCCVCCLTFIFWTAASDILMMEAEKPEVFSSLKAFILSSFSMESFEVLQRCLIEEHSDPIYHLMK